MDFKIHNSRTMLEDIISSIELSFKGSSLQLTVQRPIPEVNIKADSKRISQVMDNLIENAKRCMQHKGNITIAARILDSFLEISVRDDGPGISPEDLPHIFERFYRGEKSRPNDYGGMGLGLTICKYIVEEHGGKIRAESIHGRGTTISFTLPVITSECAFEQ